MDVGQVRGSARLAPVDAEAVDLDTRWALVGFATNGKSGTFLSFWQFYDFIPNVVLVAYCLLEVSPR